MKVQLTCIANRGKLVGTRWGRIQFDDEGRGSVDVLPADLLNLRSLGWYVGEPSSASEVVSSVTDQEVPVVVPVTEVVEETKTTKGKSKKAY